MSKDIENLIYPVLDSLNFIQTCSTYILPHHGWWQTPFFFVALHSLSRSKYWYYVDSFSSLIFYIQYVSKSCWLYLQYIIRIWLPLSIATHLLHLNTNYKLKSSDVIEMFYNSWTYFWETSTDYIVIKKKINTWFSKMLSTTFRTSDFLAYGALLNKITEIIQCTGLLG